MLRAVSIFAFFLFIRQVSFAQHKLTWVNVDSAYGPLPSSIHVYKTNDLLDGFPNIAFYVIADLKDRSLNFTTDTTYKRRFTPAQFYQKNKAPLVVVNGTFFSFETNRNLNVIISNGKLLSYNGKTIVSPADTTKRVAVYNSALGISKKRKGDVAWVKTDSSNKFAFASQLAVDPAKANGNFFSRNSHSEATSRPPFSDFKKWKIKTAIGGGPVLLQGGKIHITNEEEKMFTGKAIDDKHPRTAMGYTADNRLIILVVQGRFPQIAEGATLNAEARILQDLGCVEALNLDGGGSSCLLVNGKETITPSDKGGQRPVPGVFIIK